MRRHLWRTTLTLSAALLAGASAAQTAAAAAAQQPNRVGQNEIIPTVDGQPEKAVKLCQDFLKTRPNDLESLYNLAVAYARLGETERAAAAMRQAVEAGLPFGRFVAGPRELLRPLRETEAFRQLAAEHPTPLVHGPMLGCVSERGAKFWVRTADETPVEIVASTAKDLADPIRSSPVRSLAAHDYTAVASVEGLQPDTLYYYDVLLGGVPALGPERPSFRTFPPAGAKARFQVAFGGGAGYTEEHERMWDTVAGHRPAAFLFLGDNVYIDNPTRPAVQQYTYYRRQSRPEYRRLTASTGVYAIWDDHDFCVNDGRGGPGIDDPPWKRPVWRLFSDNWNNPAYGGGEAQPGCWFRFSIADVDFFMLDGRYYREDPKTERPSMLGPAQKRWLLDELKRSQAALRVLASPVPWVFEAKGDSPDTWRGYADERAEIFACLEENKIDGVVLLSADRHRSDVWRIDRPGAYPLYEFESSQLTNVHTHPLMPGALFGYNKKNSFGLLTFDTTLADPEVRYQIFNIDGELIHTEVVKKSRISHR